MFAFSFCFFRVKSMSNYLRDNLKVTVPMLAVTPLMTMWMSYRINDYLIYKKCLQSGMVNRYLTPVQ